MVTIEFNIIIEASIVPEIQTQVFENPVKVLSTQVVVSITFDRYESLRCNRASDLVTVDDKSIETSSF